MKEAVWVNDIIITTTVMEYMLKQQEAEEAYEAYKKLGADIPYSRHSDEYRLRLRELRQDLEHNREMVGVLITDQLVDSALKVIAKEIQE